jgi:4-hydroxybenzoate polyprenyltransferase
MDVLVLSSFYCLRIFAGAFAIGVEVSEWLLAFSLFLFFSLALAKRVSELKLVKSREIGASQGLGRGYEENDLAQLTVFGSCSGYLSVLVYALFINSPHVQAFYRHPQFLWLIFPLLLYWISRLWLIANRGELHSDPLIFALRDRMSYFSILIASLALLLARSPYF